MSLVDKLLSAYDRASGYQDPDALANAYNSMQQKLQMATAANPNLTSTARNQIMMDSMMNSGSPDLQAIAMKQMPGMFRKSGPSFKIADANTYRDDYNKEAAADKKRIGSFETMQNVVTKADGRWSASGDTALLYGYAKMLDPTGIVTDKDLDAQRKSGNMNSQVQAYVNQMVNGVLPDHVRQDLLNSAGRISNSSIESLQDTRAFYSKASAQAGIPIEQVFNQDKDFSPYETMEPNYPTDEVDDPNAGDVLGQIKNIAADMMGGGQAAPKVNSVEDILAPPMVPPAMPSPAPTPDLGGALRDVPEDEWEW